MRDISEVIDRVVAKLPSTGYDYLRADLHKLKRSVFYRAPEQDSSNWGDLCMLLTNALPPPTSRSAPEWVKEISDIVEGRKEIVGGTETVAP